MNRELLWVVAGSPPQIPQHQWVMIGGAGRPSADLLMRVEISCPISVPVFIPPHTFTHLMFFRCSMFDQSLTTSYSMLQMLQMQLDLCIALQLCRSFSLSYTLMWLWDDASDHQADDGALVGAHVLCEEDLWEVKDRQWPGDRSVTWPRPIRSGVMILIRWEEKCGHWGLSFTPFASFSHCVCWSSNTAEQWV